MKVLGAFVGRSFDKVDEGLWLEIQRNFNSLKRLGFFWEDAEEGQAKLISEKVKERIDRNDIFIGILTKRDPISKNIISLWNYHLSQTINWVTSYWVIQESGYAIGKGKKVLFLIEKGLTVPAGLNADFEYIVIDRNNPSLTFIKINEIINAEIAERIVPVEEEHAIKATALSSTEEPDEGREEKREPRVEKTALDNYLKMIDFIEQKDYSNAEKLFNLLMEKSEDENGKNIYQVVYLRDLYESGKTEALTELRQFVEKNPNYYLGIELLIDCFSFYDEYDKAEKTIIDLLAKANDEEFKIELSVLLSRIFLKQTKFDEAIDAISSFFPNTSIFSDQSNFTLYKSLADIYMAKKQIDIACALYDMALFFVPSDHSVRFDVAYNYDKVEKYLMSLYHYKTYLKAKEDPGVLNNLGVEYGSLKLVGKRIEAYKKAVEKGNTLANANLASIYINDGFFDEAKEILDKAIRKGDYHQNVDYYSSNLKEISDKEGKDEESLLEISKEYRKYILEYAKAISIKNLRYNDINGLWGTHYKDIGEFIIEFKAPNILIGTHKIEDKSAKYVVPRGLGLPITTGEGFDVKIKEISFSGIIINRGIKWTIKSKKYTAGLSYLSSGDIDISGFAILSEDIKQITFIIENIKSFEVFKGNKKSE
jgi:tetratricopeptide (TPR) repeat protein